MKLKLRPLPAVFLLNTMATTVGSPKVTGLAEVNSPAIFYLQFNRSVCS